MAEIPHQVDETQSAAEQKHEDRRRRGGSAADEAHRHEVQHSGECNSQHAAGRGERFR